jgi:hypothetical protein
VVAMLAGGEELEELSHELEEFARTDRVAAAKLAETAAGIAAEARADGVAAETGPPDPTRPA